MKCQRHFSVKINAEKITIKHWELDVFFILHFTYLGVRTHPHCLRVWDLATIWSGQAFLEGLHLYGKLMLTNLTS